MNRFTRTTTLIAVLALSFVCAYAGNAPQPKYHFNKILSADSLNMPAADVAAKSSKICSCQVLSLESKNYQHSQVLILAEKTNNGDIRADYAAARKRIEKEKRYLASVFFDKVSKTSELTGASDCKTLYRQLKDADSNLKVYDILDADIQP